MDKEDLFLNLILLNDIIRIKEYMSEKSFNVAFENNYALRFSLLENKDEITKLLMENKQVSNIVNKEWIRQCIKEDFLKNKITLLFNINNF